MDYGYQDRLDLENDLYQDDHSDLEGSEVDSELEFHLYGQLHYSSQTGETEEQDDGEKECQESIPHEAIQRTKDLIREPEDLIESKCPSHANSQLQQHLKKMKKKKEEKQNKRKSDPKPQKSSSPFFEKVIVIDSSTDVISISEDSTEEDQSICSLKGKNMHTHQTSTPAQQDSLKQESSCHALVIVDSSSSEFDSEESECESEPDSSDSDALENWMILGRGNQDGDQSISLNLEGGYDRDTDANTQDESWLISDKDKEAQIYNSDRGPKVAARRVSNRYYTDKKVRCRNCDKTGHLSKNCPEPKRVSPCFLCGTPGHISSQCPNKHCSNCGLPGHVFNSCTERPYWHKQCHRCNKTGHFFDACPEIWRQYYITTKTGPPAKPPGTCKGRSPAYCYNCSRKGHFGHACTRPRMFNGVYPNAPFISTYDTVKEINSRRHRMRLKVKELKENGFFATLPNTPLTPGPPRKKRKNSQTPLQSPSSHKPGSSHIFFNTDDTAVKPKKYKHKQEDTFRSAKPWKPKRPVPTSRNPPPSKLVLDEADDFPRGGGTGASSQRRRRRGLNKNNNKTWKNQAGNAHRKQTSNEYPADENLFIIKQRKRRR